MLVNKQISSIDFHCMVKKKKKSVRTKTLPNILFKIYCRYLLVTSDFYPFLNNNYFIIPSATYSLSFLHQVSIPLLAQLGSISTALLKTPRWETSTGILMKVWVKGSSTGAECCFRWMWRFIPPLRLWWRRVRLLLMWRAQLAGLILNARAESPRRRKQQAKKVVKKKKSINSSKIKTCTL